MWRMRIPRPRFAIVLTAIVAAAGLAIVLTARSSPRKPPVVGFGPARARVSTTAAARVTARSSIVITATVTAPVTVTEQATGPKGTAIVTRSGAATARAEATQPVAVVRTDLVTARACANGASGTAARAIALRLAYAHALARAHAAASRAAAQALKALERHRYPSVLARARETAAARARQLAIGAQASLAAQARAQAVKQVG